MKEFHELMVQSDFAPLIRKGQKQAPSSMRNDGNIMKQNSSDLRSCLDHSRKVQCAEGNDVKEGPMKNKDSFFKVENSPLETKDKHFLI